MPLDSEEGLAAAKEDSAEIGLAEEIACDGAAPLALAASKRIIVESADWPGSEAFDRQNEISGPVFTSADAIEGAAAFAEKRPPVWRGDEAPKADTEWESVRLLLGADLAELTLRHRLRVAREMGCDLAGYFCMPGSPSQRNAERHGFRLCYSKATMKLMASTETS